MDTILEAVIINWKISKEQGSFLTYRGTALQLQETLFSQVPQKNGTTLLMMSKTFPEQNYSKPHSGLPFQCSKCGMGFTRNTGEIKHKMAYGNDHLLDKTFNQPAGLNKSRNLLDGKPDKVYPPVNNTSLYKRKRKVSCSEGSIPPVFNDTKQVDIYDISCKEPDIAPIVKKTRPNRDKKDCPDTNTEKTKQNMKTLKKNLLKFDTRDKQDTDEEWDKRTKKELSRMTEIARIADKAKHKGIQRFIPDEKDLEKEKEYVREIERRKRSSTEETKGVVKKSTTALYISSIRDIMT